MSANTGMNTLPHGNSMGNYDDIINLEHPISQKYPRMSTASRAAQFAPYKTITVYHDQLDTADTQGSAVYQENEIIPDQDYYEYDEELLDSEFPEDNSA